MYNNYAEEWEDRTSEITWHVHSQMDTRKEFSAKQIRDMDLQDAIVNLPVTYFSNGDEDPQVIDSPLERIMEGVAIAEILVNQGIIWDVNIEMTKEDAPQLECTIRMPCMESLGMEPNDYQMMCNTVLVYYATHRIREALRRHMKSVVNTAFDLKPKPSAPSLQSGNTKVH